MSDQSSDEDVGEAGFTVTVPEDIDDNQREAYLRGLRDMAEYTQRVGAQVQQIYEDELAAERTDDDTPRCEECGESLAYDPSTGAHYCPDC